MTAWRSAWAQVAGALAAVLGDLAGAGDVVDHDEVLAGVGHDVEPGDLDGGRRAGLVDRAPLVVEQGADAAEAVAADDDVADLEGPLLDQHAGHARRGPPRARPPGRCRSPAGSGSAFSSCSSAIVSRVSQQLGDALAGRRRGLDDLDVAAPLDRG